MYDYHTGIGHTFNAVLEALYDTDRDELKNIAREQSEGFLNNLAVSQQMLGVLLAMSDKKEITEQLMDLGWLQASLSELALSWQHLAMPLPKKPKKTPEKDAAAEVAHEQNT